MITPSRLIRAILFTLSLSSLKTASAGKAGQAIPPRPHSSVTGTPFHYDASIRGLEGARARRDGALVVENAGEILYRVGAAASSD